MYPHFSDGVCCRLVNLCLSLQCSFHTLPCHWPVASEPNTCPNAPLVVLVVLGCFPILLLPLFQFVLCWCNCCWKMIFFKLANNCILFLKCWLWCLRYDEYLNICIAVHFWLFWLFLHIFLSYFIFILYFIKYKKPVMP